MRLSTFIERDMEAILQRWEEFAATLLPAAGDMDSTALRDHAEAIMLAVCKDIDTAQTDQQREDKSRGLAPGPADARHTAAETHALLRAKSGFNVNQMASEYRALRASVLHLWARACEPSEVYLPDMVRFNEAIDQAMVESVAFFNSQMEHERNLLLGMLGHDMRGPLQVIQATADSLNWVGTRTEITGCTARLSRSVHSLKALLDDLLVFNRTKLGIDISISPAAVDLAEAFAVELEQLRVAHAGRSIALKVTGDVSGVWDINRLNQLLGNLVVNALKYGAFSTPIRVVLEGLPGEVRISVHNNGPNIDKSLLAQIFEPLKRGPNNEFVSGTDGSFGLGLYIAREIVNSHHGDISATSDDGETIFTVRLPRLSSSRQVA
jgi:signal transduction histidine kinase